MRAGLAQRHVAERAGVALTMYSRTVTLPVFQFEMSPLKLLGKKPAPPATKLPDMSPTRETSHPEMCPCVTSAAVELASQAATAETSSERSANTPGIVLGILLRFSVFTRSLRSSVGAL